MIAYCSNGNLRIEQTYQEYTNCGKFAQLLTPTRYITIKSCRDRHMRYAADNGKFAAWAKGKEWDTKAFRNLCFLMADAPNKPDWVVVPDQVMDMEGTLKNWHQWAPFLKDLGFNLAIAVQNGMLPHHIPSDADVIFVGGDTKWKMETLPMWCKNFPNVHCARVNTWPRLLQAHFCGATSFDGSGWFRFHDNHHENTLLLYFRWITGKCKALDQMSERDIITLGPAQRFELLDNSFANGGRYNYLNDLPLFNL